ncbi:hypothetical protein RYX36_008520, partial [Vicia faba]
MLRETLRAKWGFCHPMRILGSDDRIFRRHRKNIQMEVEHDGAFGSASQPPHEPGGYSGGPPDLSLLVIYEHHCDRRLWYEK